MPVVSDGAVVIVGGTSGIGRRLAEAYAARGRRVVVTGRDPDRASEVAGSIDGGRVTACAVDLTEPSRIAACLAGVGPVVQARLSRAEAGLQVAVYLPDQKHLFARISGFFASARIAAKSAPSAKILTLRSSSDFNCDSRSAPATLPFPANIGCARSGCGRYR